MSTNPIDVYLRKLRRRWWWRRRRGRMLVEVEDHLRSAAKEYEDGGMNADDAAGRAVERLGPIDRAFSRPRRPVLACVAVAVVAVASAVAVVHRQTGSPTAPSHATIQMTASNQPVPAVMRSPPPGEERVYGLPIPIGTQIDATAPVPTSAKFVFLSYTWRGLQCQAGYLVAGGIRMSARNPQRAGLWCRSPGDPRPAIDLAVQGGSGQPFILSGTAPQAADELMITTALGHTHTFVLPHIALHNDPHRQVVILDLTAQHIRSVVRLALGSHGHTVASQAQGAA